MRFCWTSNFGLSLWVWEVRPIADFKLMFFLNFVLIELPDKHNILSFNPQFRFQNAVARFNRCMQDILAGRNYFLIKIIYVCLVNHITICPLVILIVCTKHTQTWLIKCLAFTKHINFMYFHKNTFLLLESTFFSSVSIAQNILFKSWRVNF